ncbi:hypothetical protein WJX72_006670 [[Myrmecia] bisecta]|uniref:Arginine decarboxylase n=1 Tax=[Myrmecia] bisecta TaxID=41462 RepID=A0AAW1PS17_9CHLO
MAEDNPLVAELDHVFHKRAWTPEDSAELYNIGGWGLPYFIINAEGHLAVTPHGEPQGHTIDVYEVVQTLKQHGLSTPLLLRFPEIVTDRIQQLQGCFATAIDVYKYAGLYRGVFPVKCNHDRELLKNMLQSGVPHGFGGLEVGTKAELMMAMSLLTERPGALLICNGYKDAAYIDLMLQARTLGMNAICVAEQLHEVGMLVAASKRMGVRPAVGMRAKLHTRHSGHWGATSGAGAKFGLRPCEIVALVEELEQAGMLDCLHLLHFHIGSQINAMRILKEAMREASFLFAELYDLGAHQLKFMDVGGGLGIDYDGSFSDTDASVSYTLQNYANDVVSYMQSVVTKRHIPPPTIISESGRALGSHHSVVVFDTITRPQATLQSLASVKEEEYEILTGAHGRVVLEREDSPTEIMAHMSFKNDATAEGLTDSPPRGRSLDGSNPISRPLVHHPSLDGRHSRSFERRSPSWNLGRHSGGHQMPPTIQEDGTPTAAAGAAENGHPGSSPEGPARPGQGSPDPQWRGRPASPFGGSATQAATPPYSDGKREEALNPKARSQLNRMDSFQHVYETIRESAGSLRETYEDAVYFKEEASRAFKLGVLSLKERAEVDVLFDATCERIRTVAAQSNIMLPEALRGLHSNTAEIYHVNFSVFRSMLDSWAIQQLFPIMPIHRLAEQPSVAATLADLTCDSDGKVDRFVAPSGDTDCAHALFLHRLKPGESYLMGLFCTGVYQELLGSDHNMLGSMHVARIRTAPPAMPAPATAPRDWARSASSRTLQERLTACVEEGSLRGNGWLVDGIVVGENIAEVLAKAQHSVTDLSGSISAAVEAAVAKGSMAPEKGAVLLKEYNKHLKTYTYLDLGH